MTSRQIRYLPTSPIQHLLANVGMASSTFSFSAFNPRPAPARAVASLSTRHHLDYCSRDAELGPDFLAPPTLSLGRGPSLSFRGGRWVRGRGGGGGGGGGGAGGESVAGKEEKRRIQRLKEENRLFKLEVEILLDMMTEVKMKDCDDEMEVEEGGPQATERRPTGGKVVKWAPHRPNRPRWDCTTRRN
ncbi:unnamed protein product [Lota lota]